MSITDIKVTETQVIYTAPKNTNLEIVKEDGKYNYFLVTEVFGNDETSKLSFIRVDKMTSRIESVSWNEIHSISEASLVAKARRKLDDAIAELNRLTRKVA